MFYDKTGSVERLTVTVGDSDKEQYQAVTGLEAIKLNVQPASAELTAISEGVFGQTFRAFVGPLSLKIGDRITISGANTKYIVKGIQNFNWGPIPHLELVLFLGDN